MSASTAYIQISEEEPALSLVKLVSDLKFSTPNESKNKEKEVAELSGLIEDGKIDQVLEKSVLAQLDLILNAQPKDTHAAFNICFHLLARLEAKKTVELSSKLTEALKNNPKNPLLALKLLGTLFNSLGSKSTLRHRILLAILDVSSKTQNANVLTGQLGNLEKWAKDWNLSAADEADLYLRAADVCKASKQLDERHKLLLNYLRAMEQADAKSLEKAKEPAAEVVAYSVKSKNFFDQDGVRELKAVAALADDKKYAPLYQLFVAATAGDISGLIKVQEASKSQINWADFGLSYDELLKKLRASALCSMAEDRYQIPYEDVKQQLHVDINGVEQTVIDSVVLGVIDAKLDQENQLVLVQRVIQRKFSPQSWAKLEVQLSAWKKNLHSVLSTLSQARQQQPQRQKQSNNNY